MCEFSVHYVALTEKYGRPIYHYHLHVVALLVVEKQIKWSKRCKDKALVGTVKETVMQVSHSKKWKLPQLTDENGVCIYGENAKICATVEELEAILGPLSESDEFVAGGASVYEQFLPYCDEALVTVMEQEFPADRHFPKLPELGWELVSESEPLTENEVTYRFCVYRRP